MRSPFRVGNPVAALLLCGTLVLVACGQGAPQARPAATATPTIVPPTPTATPDPAALAAQWMPKQLSIPRLGVKSKVIGVGADSNGNMLAPVDAPPGDPLWDEVYWWNGGAVPGRTGNAVIAGHVNRPTPGPAPFTALTDLRKGDTIQILATNGQTLTFAVVDIQTPSAYETGANNPVLVGIFGPSNTPNLNLITCYGTYDGHTFDHRLVVFTRLVGPSPFPHA